MKTTGTHHEALRTSRAAGPGCGPGSGHTHLPPALVSLTVPGLWTFGVTQVLSVTWHQLPVASTPALLLHLLETPETFKEMSSLTCLSLHTCLSAVLYLSAGLTAAPVTPHGAGVFLTGQTTVAGVSAGRDLVCTRQRRPWTNQSAPSI